MTTPTMNLAALQSTLDSGGKASQTISAAGLKQEAQAPSARAQFRPQGMAANG